MLVYMRAPSRFVVEWLKRIFNMSDRVVSCISPVYEKRKTERKRKIYIVSIIENIFKKK